MGKSYRPYYPEEDLLLPPSLRDWLPEKHLAYFVSDVVDHLDLSAMDAVYGNEKRGQPPYDPQMMTKVLVYGYCVGVFSSRRIERRLVEDIAFRVLGAGNQPNFRTISDFRKIHLKTLEGLFEQVLKIALEAGAMKVGRAVTGTGRSRRCGRRRGLRQRPAGRRTAGGTGAARDQNQEDPGSQTGAGSEGTREGGGRGRRSEASPTERAGSMQLHRSGIAHHEGRGWLRAGL